MSNLVSTLPEFPEYDDYFLIQDKDGKYLLLCFDNGTSFNVNDDGNLDSSGGYHYLLSADGKSWELDRMCYGIHPFTSNGYRPVFSTVDCYNTSGGLVYSGSSYSPPPSFIGVMSSSELLFSSLSDVRFLLPIILVATVGVIGFRKAWSFICGLIRGA